MPAFFYLFRKIILAILFLITHLARFPTNAFGIGFFHFDNFFATL